jgi:hypothetical protein
VRGISTIPRGVEFVAEVPAGFLIKNLLSLFLLIIGMRSAILGSTLGGLIIRIFKDCCVENVGTIS